VPGQNLDRDAHLPVQLAAIRHEERLAVPSLVQICIVVVTLAFVAVVATTILALVRLGEAAARLTSAAQVSMGQVERIVLETHALLASVREIVPPAQRVIGRFQALGDRAADLSTAVFDEIESPILTAVAVARGVTTGSSRLLELLQRRLGRSPSPNNGDQNHE
jgi:uncharacterized protein YoxC